MLACSSSAAISPPRIWTARLMCQNSRGLWSVSQPRPPRLQESRTSLETRKCFGGDPGVVVGYLRMIIPVLPRCLTHLALFARDNASMKTVAVIFVLVLITIASEIYSDTVLTSSLVSPAAPDPAAVAITHAAKHG